MCGVADDAIVCQPVVLRSVGAPGGAAVPLRLTGCYYNYSKSDRFVDHYLYGGTGKIRTHTEVYSVLGSEKQKRTVQG